MTVHTCEYALDWDFRTVLVHYIPIYDCLRLCLLNKELGIGNTVISFTSICLSNIFPSVVSYGYLQIFAKVLELGVGVVV